MTDPEQSKLQKQLDAAREVDDRERAQQVKVNTAIAGVGVLEPVKPAPIHELALDDPDSDPFNGNHNNRRVADRVAREYSQKRYLNSSEPTHLGDPVKARADVEQSLRVTGQDINYGRSGDAPTEPQPRQFNLPKPSQDSPAAKKAAAEKEAADNAASNSAANKGQNGTPAVPSWKPNAA